MSQSAVPGPLPPKPAQQSWQGTRFARNLTLHLDLVFSAYLASPSIVEVLQPSSFLRLSPFQHELEKKSQLYGATAVSINTAEVDIEARLTQGAATL